MSWKLILLEWLSTLAYDTWDSPEAVATAIVAILGALSATITTIIATFRNIDRKKGKERCRFTNKKLNKDKPDASKSV